MNKKYDYIDTEKEDVEKIHSQIEKCFNCKYFYVHSFQGRYITREYYQAVKISCPFRNDGSFYIDCEYFEEVE